MLSRVAESIYWMARYVERAENLARFIDVTLNLTLDQPHNVQTQWQPLVQVTGDDAEFVERYGEPDKDSVICFLTFDREYPNSILSVLSAARYNARSIREAISSEAWEQLNEFYHFVNNASDGDEAVDSPSEFFHQVKQHSHLFNGITDATMLRGEGWHFLNLGRMLERADKTSRILDVKYFTLLPRVEDIGTPIDDLQWSAVLRSVSGFEMYRKRHHGVTVQRVVEFLILDGTFPRAISYCVNAADDSLHHISGTSDRAYRNSAEQRLGRLRSELTYTDLQSIVDKGMHEFVDTLQTNLNEVDEGIRQTFFAVHETD